MIFVTVHKESTHPVFISTPACATNLSWKEAEELHKKLDKLLWEKDLKESAKSQVNTT